MWDELRFSSETVTTTDVDYGIRRNTDGTLLEKAGQLREWEPEKFHDRAIELLILYFRPHTRVKYSVKIHHLDRHC